MVLETDSAVSYDLILANTWFRKKWSIREGFEWSLHKWKDASLLLYNPTALTPWFRWERDIYTTLHILYWVYTKVNEWSLFVSVCLEPLRGTSEWVYHYPLTTVALKNMAFFAFTFIWEDKGRSGVEKGRTISLRFFFLFFSLLFLF